jgi:hypothetical protein
MEHKIVKIPQVVVPDVEEFLTTLARDGWELTHIYNQHAYLKSNNQGTLSQGSLNTNVDAFGRSRVSEPFTLGDYKHIYGIDQAFLNVTSSGGTVTSMNDRASVILATSASATSRAIHQTKMYHNYMPGKSQEILSSYVFGGAQPGVIKRTGYFDDYNGIFLEQDQTGSLQFVIRSATNGTGSIQENRVKQEDWNVNTLLDGEFVLNTLYAQLLYIDFQWLSVGRVRMGFVHKGVTVLCHVFDTSNEFDVAYMQSPNLPVRCEIRNTTTATGSMEQICSTVMSEGGYAESGFVFSHTNESFRSLTSGSSLPVLAIRIKNTFDTSGLPTRAFVRVQAASVFSELKTIRWTLTKLPSKSYLTTGSAWRSADSSSAVEYNTSATAWTDGKVMLSGYVAAAGQNLNQATPGLQNASGVNTKLNFIAQNYDSTDSEIYVVTAKNLTADTTNVGGTITWNEIY